MTQLDPTTTFFRRAAGSFVVVALITVVLVSCMASVRAESPHETTDRSAATTSTMSDPDAESGQFTAKDGYIADGETLSPFDIGFPAVGNLNRNLLVAVQHASTAAARDGVEIRINSGWRSERYQQGLFDDAVMNYGSAAEALKWVNTPEKSTHVTGNAVDIAPTDADVWLGQHGNQYGMCQIYANEIWHFELAVEPGGTCPQPISDASEGRVSGREDVTTVSRQKFTLDNVVRRPQSVQTLTENGPPGSVESNLKLGAATSQAFVANRAAGPRLLIEVATSL